MELLLLQATSSNKGETRCLALIAFYGLPWKYCTPEHPHIGSIFQRLLSFEIKIKASC